MASNSLILRFYGGYCTLIDAVTILIMKNRAIYYDVF